MWTCKNYAAWETHISFLNPVYTVQHRTITRHLSGYCVLLCSQELLQLSLCCHITSIDDA